MTKNPATRRGSFLRRACLAAECDDRKIVRCWFGGGNLSIVPPSMKLPVALGDSRSAVCWIKSLDTVFVKGSRLLVLQLVAYFPDQESSFQLLAVSVLSLFAATPGEYHLAAKSLHLESHGHISHCVKTVY
jgi:hypothetical protein